MVRWTAGHPTHTIPNWKGICLLAESKAGGGNAALLWKRAGV